MKKLLALFMVALLATMFTACSTNEVDYSQYETIERFEKAFGTKGIDQTLKNLGLENGEKILIHSRNDFSRYAVSNSEVDINGLKFTLDKRIDSEYKVNDILYVDNLSGIFIDLDCKENIKNCKENSDKFYNGFTLNKAYDNTNDLVKDYCELLNYLTQKYGKSNNESSDKEITVEEISDKIENSLDPYTLASYIWDLDVVKDYYPEGMFDGTYEIFEDAPEGALKDAYKIMNASIYKYEDENGSYYLMNLSMNLEIFPSTGMNGVGFVY